MKKQLLDLASNLETNGRFADADLITEAVDRIDDLQQRLSDLAKAHEAISDLIFNR